MNFPAPRRMQFGLLRHWLTWLAVLVLLQGACGAWIFDHVTLMTKRGSRPRDTRNRMVEVNNFIISHYALVNRIFDVAVSGKTIAHEDLGLVSTMDSDLQQFVVLLNKQHI